MCQAIRDLPPPLPPLSILSVPTVDSPAAASRLAVKSPLSSQRLGVSLPPTRLQRRGDESERGL